MLGEAKLRTAVRNPTPSVTFKGNIFAPAFIGCFRSHDLRLPNKQQDSESAADGPQVVSGSGLFCAVLEKMWPFSEDLSCGGGRTRAGEFLLTFCSHGCPSW